MNQSNQSDENLFNNYEIVKTDDMNYWNQPFDETLETNDMHWSNEVILGLDNKSTVKQSVEESNEESNESTVEPIIGESDKPIIKLLDEQIITLLDKSIITSLDKPIIKLSDEPIIKQSVEESNEPIIKYTFAQQNYNKECKETINDFQSLKDKINWMMRQNKDHTQNIIKLIYKICNCSNNIDEKINVISDYITQLCNNITVNINQQYNINLPYCVDKNNYVEKQTIASYFNNTIKYININQQTEYFDFTPYVILNIAYLQNPKLNMLQITAIDIFEAFFLHIEKQTDSNMIIENFDQMIKIFEKYSANVGSIFSNYLNNNKNFVVKKIFINKNINVEQYDQIITMLKNIMLNFESNKLNLLISCTDYSYENNLSYEKIIYIFNGIDLKHHKNNVINYFKSQFLNKSDESDKFNNFYKSSDYDAFYKSWNLDWILYYVKSQYLNLNIKFFNEFVDNDDNTFGHVVLHEIIKMCKSNKSNKLNKSNKSNKLSKLSKLQNIFKILLIFRVDLNICNKNNESITTIWNDNKKMFDGEFKLLDTYFNTNQLSSESNAHQSMSKNFIGEYNEKNLWIFTFFNRTIY